MAEAVAEVLPPLRTSLHPLPTTYLMQDGDLAELKREHPAREVPSAFAGGLVGIVAALYVSIPNEVYRIICKGLYEGPIDM